MAGSELRDAALSYAERGWAVFPLKARSKEPATTNGFKDATTDPELVAAWWSAHPDHNVGIATEASGLLAVDVDVDEDKGEDGMAYLRAWEARRGELPETVSSLTGRGGCHLLYAGSGVKQVINPDAGIDVKCNGGYVVAPPSVHPNGRRYEWENDPEDFEVVRADGNVLALVESLRGRPGRKPAGVPKRIKEGGRNDALYRLACQRKGKGDDDDLVAAFLHGVNRTRVDPPLPDAEVDKIARSAIDYCNATAGRAGGAREWAEKRPPKARFDHAAMAKRLMSDHGACFIDGMPAVRVGEAYRTGWREINALILEMADGCTQAQRRETCSYVEIKAPRVRQSDPRYIAFSNGVLDVATMELLDYGDDMVIPNVIPHRWNPYASCAAVDETLRKVACGDPGMELNLAEVMGLCMYRSAKFGYCPILLGSGSNGKSTYIGMLKALLGAENVSSLDIGVIGQRFQAGNLVGKLANLGDDISNEYIPGDVLAVVKKVATGNAIFTDVKGGQGFEFDPYCTMVFSANKFPRLGDSSDGMMRRLFPMQFDARFSAEDPDFDPDIAEKLAGEAACEYMCAVGVEGLRRVLENKELTPNNRSRTMADDIRTDNDTVLQWIDAEGLDETFAVGSRPQEVYSSYHQWCIENGCKAVGSRSFNGTLRHRWHVKSVPNGHGELKGKRVTYRVYRKEE